MNVGINARVFGVETPDGAAQVGIKHTKNLLQNPDCSCILYGHPNGKQWFDTIPSFRSSLFRWNSQAYGIAWERTILPALAVSDSLDILFCPNANTPPAGLGTHSTVMMIHHVGAEHGHSPIQRAYRKLMIPLGVRRADAVVTVSEFSKEKIVESLPVDEKNVHVIYNGVDSIFFNQNAGVPVDLPEEYILFVGSADKRKNLKRLIEAYESIEDSIELVVVGPQNDLAYGGEGINRDNLLNLGYVTQEELRYIYENATLFAYPSLYEGFGLPPVEAAACGTPVMTSNLTAMPEVMGNAAEFVDPYDVESIRQGLDVINDPERLQELSELGRKQAKKYTWKKSTDRLIKIFNKMS